ncbi:MAG: hypothetical protein RL199_1135 [Pseudomonadota bacterium]|jgi:hypothetical protein
MAPSVVNKRLLVTLADGESALVAVSKGRVVVNGAEAATVGQLTGLDVRRAGDAFGCLGNRLLLDLSGGPLFRTGTATLAPVVVSLGGGPEDGLWVRTTPNTDSVTWMQGSGDGDGTLSLASIASGVDKGKARRDVDVTGAGEVAVFLQGGDDRLDASAARLPVRAYGESGVDVLVGGAAEDLLDGGDGDDTLDGRAGCDRLAGGTGTDLGLDGDALTGGVEADFASGRTACDAPDARCVGTACPDDGVDDRVGLQSLLDGVPAGSAVRLPPGTFTLAAPLKVPPGVLLAGAGMDRTTLALAPGSWSHFGYAYLVMPKSQPASNSPVTGVRDLTLDGSRNLGGFGENEGGGLALGDAWRVDRVRFTNLNYFKLWAKDTHGARVRCARFENPPGTSSSANDNVGGGGNVDLTLESLTFGPSTAGNVVDLLNSERLTIRGQLSGRGSIYLEGAIDSSVVDSVVEDGSIVLQTDVGYGSSTKVINPKGNRVARNTVVRSPYIGIAVRYDADNGKGLPVVPGGGNVVENNLVSSPQRLGIAVFGAADACKATADELASNVVENVVSPAPGTTNVGYGVFPDAGLGLSIGDGDYVHDNLVRDTQVAPTTRRGVVIGASSSQTTPKNTRLSGNVEQGLVP